MVVRDIQFESSLTDGRIEHAYAVAVQAHQQQRQGFADTGYRAAKLKDPKLLKALERMAESTGKLQDRQLGRTIRDPGSTFAQSRGTTEHQLCREAYRMADSGTPHRAFEWIYGAAAFLCGYNL